MKDYQVTHGNLAQFIKDLQSELGESNSLIVTTQNPDTGKWGMARLWRTWMMSTGLWMAERGSIMPLMIKLDGTWFGERPFSPDDAHELFTHTWLGVDEDGNRLSWSKSGRDGMRPATKGERFIAMQRHEAWALEKGIILVKPRDSEYSRLEKEQNQ